MATDDGEARQDAMAKLCADMRRLQGRYGDDEPSALVFWTCGQLFEAEQVTFSDWHAETIGRDEIAATAVLVTSEAVSTLTFTGLRHDRAWPPADAVEPGALNVVTRRIDEAQALQLSLVELDPAHSGRLEAHAVKVHFRGSSDTLDLPFATMRRGRFEYLSRLRSAIRLQGPGVS